MKLKDGVCDRCIRVDQRRSVDEPFLYSAANQMDPGDLPPDLPEVTQVEEMLIARVHIFMEVRRVRGQQYKYSGHVVSFLQNVAQVYRQLPRLPRDLDIIMLKPSNSSSRYYIY